MGHKPFVVGFISMMTVGIVSIFTIEIYIKFFGRRVSVAAVKGQCLSLLGRLEVLGPGTAAAAGRRKWALVQEQRWRKDRQGRC